MTLLGSTYPTSPLFDSTRKCEVARIYTTGQPVIDAGKRGEIPCLSYKVDVVSASTGGQDSTIAKVANDLKATGIRDGFLIQNHEPENDGGFTPAQWRASQARFYAIAGPILRPIGWKLGPCLMAWTLDSRSGRNPDDWWMPEADILFWDTYNKGNAGDPPKPTYCNSNPNDRSPATVYGSLVAYSKLKGKPFAITETACARRESDTSGVERTQWWRSVADSGVLKDAVFITHYERSPRDNPPRADYAIAGEPASRAQFFRLGTVSTPPPPDDCAELAAELATVTAERDKLTTDLATLTTDFNAVLAKRDAYAVALDEIHAKSARV